MGAGRLSSFVTVSEVEPGIEGEERWRLFVALDLPDQVRAGIAAWQRANARPAEAGNWRPVPAPNLHLTLAFLGAQPATGVSGLAELLGALELAPLPARLLADPVPLPRRHPRLIALEVASEPAVALQAALAAELHGAGLLKPGGRAFWPHITTFRRSPAAARRASRGARIAPFGEEGGRRGHAFGFVRVALYRSENRPEGSSYSRLAARDLPRPGGQTEEVN